MAKTSPSIQYTVEQTVIRPAEMAGVTRYSKPGPDVPDVGSVLNQMMNSGVTEGKATCTMDGYVANGIQLAPWHSIWHIKFTYDPTFKTPKH